MWKPLTTIWPNIITKVTLAIALEKILIRKSSKMEKQMSALRLFFKFIINFSIYFKACQFNLTIFDEKKCGKDTDYGFKEGKPCIILSLNRLIGWKPQPFEEGAVPDVVHSRYVKNSIAFYCNGTVSVNL